MSTIRWIPHPPEGTYHWSWFNYFPCVATFRFYLNCSNQQIHRVYGRATLVGTISSCTRRWMNSSSTPTQTTTCLKSILKVKSLKSGEGKEPDSQQQGGETFLCTVVTNLRSRFSGSAHVQHLQKHPAKYEAAVVDFLKQTMGASEEEEVLEYENKQRNRASSKSKILSKWTSEKAKNYLRLRSCYSDAWVSLF